MLKPLLTGFAETSIHTTKLQIDVDVLAKKLSALEIVFNDGRGQNFIHEDLISKIADEVSKENSLEFYSIPFSAELVPSSKNQIQPSYQYYYVIIFYLMVAST